MDVLTETKLGKAYFMYMKIIAVLGYSSLVVSGGYILNKKTSQGVSVVALGIHMAVSCSWLTYGYLRNDMVIKIGAIVSICTNIFVLTIICIVNSPSWGDSDVPSVKTSKFGY